ncbi:MAG TPA: CmcJ/NvfI family oxidoreductase [Candidatus Binataceae bacterium]
MSSATIAAETAAPRESVQATLNYLAPMTEKPHSYAYEPPPGEPQTNRVIEKQMVAIHDARAIESRLSLDREGFTVVHKQSAVADFFDDDEVRTRYYPECERILAEATGAVRVVVFDHIVRSATRAKLGAKGVKLPAKGVHNDYTLSSGPQRVRDFFPEEAERLLENRFAIINVWRPIHGTVQESPLAVCDAQSIRPTDFVASDLIYPHRRGEIMAVTFNPTHRWYYVSAMRPDEVLLLKCFDSALDGRARFTAHTAFSDPTSKPDAPARESIETRAFVFFPPEKKQVGRTSS